MPVLCETLVVVQGFRGYSPDRIVQLVQSPPGLCVYVTFEDEAQSISMNSQNLLKVPGEHVSGSLLYLIAVS